MKKICLIALMVLITVVFSGCGGGQSKELSKKDLVMIYNSLNSRYIEVIDFYEALQDKTISKFNWRIIADSAKSSSQRAIETVKDSTDPMVPTLIEIAEDIIALTEELEGDVDYGKEADWSYKEKIEQNLEELAPEINEIKKELLE
ncbi:MAG: hypothetical protein ACOX2P_05185 [Bacillota bacterium]|jgi:hypothetical protein